jgi:hypothetical protein
VGLKSNSHFTLEFKQNAMDGSNGPKFQQARCTVQCARTHARMGPRRTRRHPPWAPQQQQGNRGSHSQDPSCHAMDGRPAASARLTDMHVGLACAARAQRARSRRPRPCACPFTSAIAIATISGRPGWMDAWSMEEGVRTGMVALARRSTCHIHAPRACTT